MQHLLDSRAAAWLPATFALCLAAACATQPAPQQTQQPQSAERSEAPGEQEQSGCIPDERARSFQPADSYGGNIRWPVDSTVITGQPGYDAFVEHLPEKKVTKRYPPPDSDDPLLKKPPIDFDEQMLVVATCPTFYCTIEFVGIRDGCDRTVIVVELPGEGEHAEYYARPAGIGNYRALRVPRVDGPFEFEYRGPGQRPGAAD